MNEEKSILDVIQLGPKKIRIIGKKNEILDLYSFHILNFENYDYIHIGYNLTLREYQYQISVMKSGQYLLTLSDEEFAEFQTFVDLNILLDLDPGTIEGLLLEVKMQNS